MKSIRAILDTNVNAPTWLEHLIARTRNIWGLRLWAGVGVLHYAIALIGWSLDALLLLKQRGDRAGWIYVAVRAIPCLIMFAGFVMAMVQIGRRRRFAMWILSSLTVASLAWFGLDAHRHDYQMHASTDHGCDHYYTTWWWYNDRWDPNR